MAHKNDEGLAAVGAAKPSEVFCLTTEHSQLAPKTNVAQAKIELLVDDIGDNIGIMIAVLEAGLAMRAASDVVGLIYSLRRARVYWKAISASAAELVAADAERLSALRQGGSGQ
jgi:hypothetical protein